MSPAPASPPPADPQVPASRADTAGSAQRLPLRGWALDLARRWNSGAYSLFVLHGNVFDVFPLQDAAGTGYAPLKAFLARRIFPDRGSLLFYDIGDGLTFATPEMQGRFFRWLEIYDQVEHTNFHQAGLPHEFVRLAPILRRWFLRSDTDEADRRGATLIIDFPEKIVPAAESSGSSNDERTALVTLLKWASSPELRRVDAGVLLVTESAADVSADLLRNPNVAQVRIDLPDVEDRAKFLASPWTQAIAGKPLAEWSDLPAEELGSRTAGLSLLRIQQMLAEASRNGARVTFEHVSKTKKRLIEEWCQGLVRFKDPKPGTTLDLVATHAAAKKRLREIAWLIRNRKDAVLERGILVPGRVGVGKSFLIDCFAGECGLPVMEMGEFRSKWVGDTERNLSRILMTIRALGPVVVVVDEADAVFGNREESGDSGVSSRTFASLAAHIGDSSLRGRELWVAMTSRPDLLSIDMKRQGRFGLCIPLFPAQGPDDVAELFRVIAKTRRVTLDDAMVAFVRTSLGDRPLTGSDVEAIVVRALERAVLASRDDAMQVGDLEEAVASFIDPLDADLLALQELAAVLACSDRRYLPERWAAAHRGEAAATFSALKMRRMLHR